MQIMNLDAMERLLLGCFLCVIGIAVATPAPPTACTTDGKYGPNCVNTCGHCKTPPCDKTTGACAGGCQPGWKSRDLICKTECDNGHFGDDCKHPCSAQCSSSPCSKTDGSCICNPGYQPPQCLQECKDGKYGMNCASTCGHCKDNVACNHVTGRCLNGCSDGYTGAECHNECPGSSYGEGCKSSCGHCYPSGSTCNHITGRCPNNCMPGFQPSMCQEECQAGGWGKDCLRVCSQNCQNSQACNKTSGQCTCKPGFKPPLCDTQCQSGLYGQDCSGACGECLTGNDICDHVTGNCTQCKDNREMPLCQVCIPGKYGSTCSQDCENCGGDGRCHRATGVCTASVCRPGWMSTKCDQKCLPGSYGQGCSQKCGHCRNNSPCRHDNGMCEHDCEEDYEGVLCQRSKQNVVGAVVGSLLGAGLLIAVAIVLSVCFLKWYSSSKSVSRSREDFTTMAEMAPVDGEDGPATPQVSEVYQNLQVNHNDEQVRLNPVSNYDRVDMKRKTEDAHFYEKHSALNAQAAALRTQDTDPLYQNASDAMATPLQDPKKMAGAEPEATYGNI